MFHILGFLFFIILVVLVIGLLILSKVPYFRLSIFYHTGCSGDWIAHSFQSRQSGIRIQASYAR